MKFEAGKGVWLKKITRFGKKGMFTGMYGRERNIVSLYKVILHLSKTTLTIREITKCKKTKIK
jgi:hypothetical protein